MNFFTNLKNRIALNQDICDQVEGIAWDGEALLFNNEDAEVFRHAQLIVLKNWSDRRRRLSMSRFELYRWSVCDHIRLLYTLTCVRLMRRSLCDPPCSQEPQQQENEGERQRNAQHKAPRHGHDECTNCAREKVAWALPIQ